MPANNTVLARVVLNTDELDSLIKEEVNRHPTLKDWLEGTFRKWCLNKAPAEDTVMQTTKGLPEWMLKEKAVNVKLADIRNVLESGVLDFLENQVQLKGESALRTGVEAAQGASAKWHKKLTTKKMEVPKDTDGVHTVYVFPNAWRVVSLTGSKAMEDEGNAMGHCVGRGYYHAQSLLGNKKVYSLRDGSNVPHATIDIEGTEVYQIQGKANLQVKKEYIKYILEFLKSLGAITVSHRADYKIGGAWKAMKKAEAKKYNGSLVWKEGRTYFVSYEGENIVNHVSEYSETDLFEGFHLIPDASMSSLIAISLYIKDKEVADKWKAPIPFIDSFPGKLEAQVITLDSQDNELSLVNLSIFDAILLIVDYRIKDKNCVVAALHKDGILEISPEVNANKVDIDRFSNILKKSGAVKVEQRGAEVKFLTAKLKAITTDSSDIKDNPIPYFLAGLRQPTTKDIYKTRDKPITENLLTAVGIPVGGTTKMAFAMVLACCINDNKEKAAEFLLSKPNAVKNYMAVMDDEDIPGVTTAIRNALINEYLYLLPTLATLSEKFKKLESKYSSIRPIKTIHELLWSGA